MAWVRMETHKTEGQSIKAMSVSGMKFHAELHKEGKLYFEADSDAIITKVLPGY